MNTIGDRADISRILMQVRDMQTQLQDNSVTAAQQDVALKNVDGLPPLSDSKATGFGDLLKQAVDSVNDTQMKSAELQKAYELGDESVDLTEVMIQMQKATVSFEAMTQVRNRLISAYQDIMNTRLVCQASLLAQQRSFQNGI
jgi:flagellar hook-basal body complex protein FliE